MQFLKNLLCKNTTHHTSDLLWKYEAGSFFIGYGKRDVTIKTKGTPCKVWLVPETPCGDIPVCIGGTNMVGVDIIHNGFIIHADIQTDKCEVEWFAELI